MTYLKVDANETSLCLPTSHSLPGGRIAVYMENEKGVSQTSWFTVPPSGVELFFLLFIIVIIYIF